MYVTRRARRLAPIQIRALLAASAIVGAGAFCLAVLVAYGWGMTSGAASSHGQNAIFTALVALLIGFVVWLWRQLAATREEMFDNRRSFK